MFCNLFRIFIDYGDNANQKQSSSKANRKKEKGEENGAKREETTRSQEEKRKHIKSIIEKIPVAKADLFNYKLQPEDIDEVLKEKIRPWINKKIIEYIGEPEPTLVDFICSKLSVGSTPQGILDDVQMVSRLTFNNLYCKNTL